MTNMIVCDLDNTLLDDEKWLSPKEISILKKICNKHYFTIATARDLSDYLELNLQIPLNLPIILCNGSIIYDFWEKKVIKKECISKDSLSQLKKTCDMNWNMVMCDKEIYRQESYIRDVEKSIVSISKRGNEDEILYLYKRLNKIQGVNLKIFHDRNKKYILEIINQQSNKGRSVKYLKDKYTIGQINLIAFGDNGDDYSMIEQAIHGYCVGEDIQLKKICTHKLDRPRYDVIKKLNELI